MSFIAGPYLAVYNSKVIGQTEDGFHLHRRIFKRLIKGDWMGEGAQDAINMGCEVTSDFTLLEADAPAVIDIIKPYNGSAGGVSNIYVGQVGTMDVKHGIAKPLVLTGLLTSTVINANGGTGASSVTPLTRTLPLSIIAENFSIDELLAADLRSIPISMRHYPSAHTQSTGTGGGFFGVDA